MASVGPLFIGTAANASLQTTDYQMNASGEGVAFVFVVPKSGEIDQILFMVGTAASSESLTVTMETVGTDGLPTGTLYDASAAGGVVATPAANTTATATFSGDTITAVAGDLVCVRIEFTSFSSGDVAIRAVRGTDLGNFPYITHDTGSGNAKVVASTPKPTLVLHYTDATYIVPIGCYPPCRISSVNIQSGTTPDEIAMQYTAPCDMRLVGMTFMGRDYGTTALVDFEVFDDDGSSPTLLSTVDANLPHDALGTNQCFVVGLQPLSISASAVINPSIFSNDGTNNLTVYYMEVDNANYWGDFAQGLFWATRTDAGAFTETATRKPIGGLWFDQITTSSSGAVLLGANKRGGMQ